MARDEAGYDELVRARLPHLMRFGHALTGSEAGAADLVQDALERTLAAWPRHEVDAEEFARRAMLERYLSRGSSHPPEQGPWAALADLPPKERAVLVLRHYEGLTDGQIAEVMRCSTGTVQSRANQASARLGAMVPTADVSRLRGALDDVAPADETRLLLAAREGAARRRARRTTVTAGVAAALSLVLVAVVIVLARAGTSSKPSVGPDGHAVAMAATDASHLWAIAPDPKCSSCSILWFGDGTASGWTKRHSFDRSAAVSQVRMAPNGRDGWAWFGRDWLLATHDGGASWVVPGIDLHDANVDVQVAGGSAWALLQESGSVHVWRTGFAGDDWTEVPVPASRSERWALAPLRDEMFLVEYLTDGGTALSRLGSRARSHPVPCADHPVPPRSSAGAMYVTCPDDGYGLAVKRTLDGVTWKPVSRSVGTAEGSYPISDEQTFVVTGIGGRIVSSQVQGDVPLELQGAESVDDGAFVTPSVGFLLTSLGRLLRTDDGGRSWRSVG